MKTTLFMKTKRYFIPNILCIYIVFIGLVFVGEVNAQTNIFYTDFNGNPLPLKAVHTCQDSSFINQARIEITSDDVDSLIVSVNTPTGVEFILGTERIVSSSRSDGLTLQYIGPDPVYIGQQNFRILPYDLLAGDYFTIEWGRQADCSAIPYQQAGEIFKDYVILAWDGGSLLDLDDDVRSYDVLVPALSIQGEGPIVTALGSSVMREITVTNGGLGQLDEFSFYINDGVGTMTTQLETPAGTVLAPSSMNGDTLFYTLSSAEIAEFGDNDVHFENGEQVVLKRTYTVTECDNNSSYQAAWGCGGDVCQTTSPLDQSTVIENVVPNLDVTMPNVSPDYCFDGSNSIDGGAPVIQTVKVENVGNGPATNFEFTMRNYQSGSNTGSNYFSTALWTIKDAGGNVIGSMSNHTTLQTAGKTGTNCGWADQITRLKQEAIGIVIPPGEAIYLEIPTYVPNYECTNDCAGYYNSSWWSFSAEWAYQDQCEMNNYGVSDKRFDNRAHNFENYTVEMPTDLIDGQEFTADVYYSNLYTRVKSSTEGYVELIVDLSNSNLVYNGGPTITAPWGGQLPVTVVGDSIFIKIQSNLNAKTGLLPIKLRADCAGQSGGSQSVGFSHHTKYDHNCPGDGLYKYCITTSFQMHCPFPCPKGGATPKLFTLERQTKGLQDYDENHLPDNNLEPHPDSINLHRVVNGDVVMGTWNIKVHPNTVGPNAGTPFNYTYVEFDLRDHPYAYCTNGADNDFTTIFTPLDDAEVTVFPSGGGAPITCTAPPIIVGTIAKYDLSACQNVWNGGDSIVVQAKYTANASIVNTGFMLYIADNNVYSSYIQNPVGANPSDENKYTCDHFNDYMNLLNIYSSPYMPSPQDIDGCSNSFVANSRQYVNVQANAVWFPNEYRNFSIQDEYKIYWPSVLEYRPGTAMFSGLPIPDADVSQVGDTLTFSNLSHFYTINGGTLVPRDEIEARSVTWSVDPSCDAEAGKIYYSRFYMNQLGNGVNTPSAGWDSYYSCTTASHLSSYGAMKYDGPLPFITGGGSEQVSGNTAEWQVVLNNGSNSLDADNTWFYVQDINGTLMNFTVKQGGTVLTPNANGFFEIGNNPATASTPYTVVGELQDCADGKIALISGYHCSDYPLDINNLSCSDTVILESTNLPSEVQLAFIQQPTVPMELCVDQPLKLKQTSAQAAFLDDPKLSFNIPAGVLMPATVNVEYPEGSGFIEALTPTIVGNIWTINFEDHTHISAEGIPGTIDALTPQERSILMDFSFGTDCNFLSGDNFVFQAFGMRPCGLPAINNGVRVRTVDLNVDGVDAPYANNFTIETPVFIGCSPKTLNADIQFVGLNSLTTSTQDSVYIILEQNIQYVPGSFVCTSPAGSCLEFDHTTTDALGNTVVVLRMPAGGLDISDPLTSSFAYQVHMANDDICDNLKRIDYRVITNLGNVPCITEPTNFCPSLAVTLGQAKVDVKVKKTVLSFDGEYIYCNEASGASYSGTIKVDSVAIEAGSSLILDIYCVDNVGGVGEYTESITLPGPIAIGGTVSFAGMLSALCNPENGVYIKAGNVSQDNTEQCICEDQLFLMMGTPVIECSIVQNSPVVCNGEKNGSATVTATGGNGTYTYLWDNGDTRMTADTLAAGIHTVVVKDSKNCESTCSVTITEPDPLTCTVVLVEDVDCNGGTNGKATVIAAGGNGSYTYIWDDGETVVTATMLSVGVHTVEVTDAKGCKSTCSITINEPPALTCSIVADGPVTCFGDSDGQATVTPVGGNGGYIYAWDNNETTAQAVALNAGNHEVTVTDSKGCTTLCTVTILGPPVLTCTVVETSPVVCNGESNGSATVTPVGGNGGNTYAWDNGETTEIATALNAGQHTVAVTDSKNCTTTCIVTITEPIALTCTVVEVSPVVCNGESNGSATVTPMGGNGGYTYAWDNGETTATATMLNGGLHTVTVIDNMNCMTTCMVTISEPAALSCSIVMVNPVVCNGESSGSATVTPVGGNAGGFTYLWDNNESTVTAFSLNAGQHTVTVTDSKNCTTTCMVTITEPTALSCTVEETSPVVCNGESNGSATVTPMGGNGGNTYAWDNGETTAIATALNAGQHTVTVTDNNNCMTTCTVMINEPVALTCTITMDNQAACNGETNGAATVTAIGGNGGNTYVWGNGETTATATMLGAGQHTVTVTDSKNCTTTCMVTITEPTSLSCTVEETSPVVCNGESNGSATVTPVGGNGGNTYAWDNGETTAIATMLNAGAHTVMVTDSKNCTTSCVVDIMEPMGLSCSTLMISPVVCNGESNGVAKVTALGGNGGYTYSWDSGEVIDTAFLLDVGLHTVTVTDSKNCMTTCTVMITEPQPLTCAIGQVVNVDCNGNSTGHASVTPQGGNGSYTYLWDDGETTATALLLDANTHTVTITDNKGCTTTCSVGITEPVALTCNAIQVDQISCNGADDGVAMANVVGGTGTYVYAWDNGETTQSTTMLSPGLHTVVITDDNNCTTSCTVTITEPDVLTCTVQKNNDPNCIGTNGSATVNPVGGNGGFTYVWSNGETGQTATQLTGGTHTVNVTDSENCTSSCSIVMVDQMDCITLVKSIQSVTQTAGNCYDVIYAITVDNFGQAPATYNLYDTLSYDDDIIVNAVSYTGDAVGFFPLAITTAGQWILSSNQMIAVGKTDTYMVTVSVCMDLEDGVIGDDSYTACGIVGNGGTMPQKGLFNNASLDSDTDGDIDMIENACADLPYIIHEKQGPAISTQNADLSYDVTYTILVQNIGGATGTYDLNDIPNFDDDITINNGTFTATNGLSGTLSTTNGTANSFASNQELTAVATDTYTATFNVTLDLDAASTDGGDNIYTACGNANGAADPTTGEGLYNQSTLDTNGDGTPEQTDEVCGDLPNIIHEKQGPTIASQNADLSYDVTYTIVVTNNGGATGPYTLMDIPNFDDDITINNGTFTATNGLSGTLSTTNGTANSLATNQELAAGTTDTYTATFNVTLDLDAASTDGGDNSYTACGNANGAADPTTGEGLYNQSTLDTNGDGTPEQTDEVCGDLPYIIHNKQGPSVGDRRSDGTYDIVYIIEVENIGGAEGMYDLNDIPNFEDDITINSGSFTSTNGLTGTLSTTNGMSNVLADDQVLVAGLTDTYTVSFNVTLDLSAEGTDAGDNIYDPCMSTNGTSSIAGEGLYNQSTLDTNNDGVAEQEDSVCGDIWIFDLANVKRVKAGQNPRYKDEIVYEIIIFNQGNITAQNVDIIDYLPQGLSYSTNNDATWIYDGVSHTVTKTITESILPGDSIVKELILVLEEGPDWINYSEITGAEDDNGIDMSDADIDSNFDDDNDNDNGGQSNTDTDNQTDDNGTIDEDDHDPAEINVFDLALRKTVAEGGPFLVGDTAIFNLTVFNQGNVDAFNIELIDYVNSGFVFSPGANTGWAAQGGNAVYTISGPLVAKDSIVIPINLIVQLDANPTPEDWLNYAEISAADDDTDNTNMPPVDFDSNADAIADNDNTVLPGDLADDELNGHIQDAGADEDDHDVAVIVVVGGLGDQVWKDLDGDGIQDDGEPGIQGVYVTLSDCDGNEVATTFTDINGNYFFDNLIPDFYMLNFNISGMSGMAFTLQDQGDDALDSDVDLLGNTPCIDLNGGGYDSTWDVGVLPLSSMGNFVWHDIDGDGVQDAGEPGIPNVVVNLYNGDGLLWNTTTTDNNGYYIFDGLYPGDYYVEFEQPDGYSDASPANQGINEGTDSDVDNSNGIGTTAYTNISAGENDMSWDAGFYHCIPIGNLVWYDVNENDIWDSVENGINGLTVNIYQLNGSDWVLYDNTLTGHKPGTPSDDGWYEFCVDPGEYYIEVILPPLGIVPTVAHVGTDELIDSDIDNTHGLGTTASYVVTSGDTQLDVGAGYYPMAQVGDRVWLDANENGIQESYELPVSDVLVKAYDTNGLLISEDVTNGAGRYNLDYLGRDDYYLKFVLPSGYGATTADVGNDDMDSDIDHSNGYNTTKLYHTEPGDSIVHVDAGLITGVLPVVWNGISATNQGTYNLVKWSTSSELNTDHFEVEVRHEDDQAFNLVDRVKATGNSATVSNYQLNDKDIERIGRYYYRVKLIDLDGKEDYTKTVSVVVGREVNLALSLFPNPTVNQVSLSYELVVDSDVKVSLYDIKGSVVQRVLIDDYREAGYHEEGIDLRDIPADTYLLRIVIDGRVYNKRLIVLNR